MIGHWFFPTAPRRLVESTVFRQVADAVFRARARRSLARFDRLTPAQCQRRILLGLTNRAEATPFGRDHDLGRIRTEADYRRLVPLRTPAELRRARVSPPRDGTTLLRAAWETALALVVGARPQARLLSGDVVFLGGYEDAALPTLVRPFTLRASDMDHVTCLAGPADRILSWLDRAKDLTRLDRLAAILYSRRSPADNPTTRLREALGGMGGATPPLLLETRFLPEGPVAVEDPRRGCLTPLFDHGVYFEFTPVAEAGKPEPTRHSLGEVEAGVLYELAMTSPAGAWACRTGLAVRFERRDPPQFRFVEMPVSAAAGADAWKVLTRPPCPPQAPHRPIVGIPAAPPEKLVHSPWSAPADRG